MPVGTMADIEESESRDMEPAVPLMSVAGAATIRSSELMMPDEMDSPLEVGTLGGE